jgi:uncharacterized membrane protein
VESKAKLFGHPIHQMLIAFPVGLLATSVVFDLMRAASGSPIWGNVAYYMMIAGIVGGLAAAVFGFIDWLAIPAGTRAKRLGGFHGVGNLLVVLCFAASAWLRSPTPVDVPTMATILAVIGAAVAVVTSWMGGELVDRLGVGVHDGAHLDAPSSLRGAPASAPRQRP